MATPQSPEPVEMFHEAATGTLQMWFSLQTLKWGFSWITGGEPDGIPRALTSSDGE